MVPMVIQLADLIFELSGGAGIRSTDLSPFFFSFITENHPGQADCRVEVLGGDPELFTEPGVHPWRFRLEAGRVELLEHDEAGAVVWRLRASETFDEATLDWNPRAFAPRYPSLGKALGGPLGRALAIFSLVGRGGMLFHSAAAVLAGEGVIFAGPSGRGKSTRSKLLDAAGVPVLTDEWPIMRRLTAADGSDGPERFRVYGSPWPSAGRFARNASAPLKRLYFLEHGPVNRIEPVSRNEAIRRFMVSARVPWHFPAFLDPMLATINAFLAEIPCAVLHFKPTPEVVDFLLTPHAPGGDRPTA